MKCPCLIFVGTFTMKYWKYFYFMSRGKSLNLPWVKCDWTQTQSIWMFLWVASESKPKILKQSNMLCCTSRSFLFMEWYIFISMHNINQHIKLSLFQICWLHLSFIILPSNFQCSSNQFSYSYIPALNFFFCFNDLKY